MRIAHVVGTFPPHIGGMGKVAGEECRLLAQRGHEITVFTLAYPQVVYHDESESYKIVRLPAWLQSGDAGFVPALLNKLRGFDLIHLHYPFYGGAEWVWVAHLLRKQKYVVTYHMQAWPATLLKKMIQKVYDWFLTGVILRSAEKILLVDKDYFLSVPASRLILGSQVEDLPNPVSTEQFVPQRATAADVGVPEWQNKKIILFVGNLMPVKRLDLLIEALERLGDDCVLLVVGGGYAEEYYKKIVEEKNLATRVKFVGVCLNEIKLATYYNVAACVAVPSEAESFSLIAAEAMASGCLVVASDIPGIRGRIKNGETGFLFSPGSVHSLVENIKAVLALSPNGRQSIAERGRQEIVSRYSLEQHAGRLERIYQSL